MNVVKSAHALPDSEVRPPCREELPEPFMYAVNHLLRPFLLYADGLPVAIL